MIDKERIIKELWLNHSCVDRLKEQEKEDLIRAIRMITIGLIEQIKRGDYDIKQEAKEKCRWHIQEKYEEYVTSCGNFDNIHGDLKSYKYCPYCSKPIEVVDDEG